MDKTWDMGMNEQSQAAPVKNTLTNLGPQLLNYGPNLQTV